MRKMMAIVVMALVMALPLKAQPNVKVGGLFYLYHFYWTNADFNNNTNDHDAHYYMHGDINVTADFNDNASMFVRVAAAGNFGSHPIYGAPGDPKASLQEAYLKIKKPFDLPVCFKVGKQRVAYDNGLLLFDGGEDGELGVNAKVTAGPATINLFGYKLIEEGGMVFIGTGAGTPGVDETMYGLYATIAPVKIASFDLFGVTVKNFVHWDANGNPVPTEKNDPMWMGFRGYGNLPFGLDYSLAYVMMSGKDASGNTTVNYKGNAIEAIFHYKVPVLPVKIGGGYVSFSGDDTSTVDYEGYFNPLNGPYAYDNFYDGWVGFGPAFMLNTPYGFDLVGFPPVSDLNVINGNLAFSFAGVHARLDFFKYSHPKAGKDCGQEIALNLGYALPGGVWLGGGFGYWMPKDQEGKDPMIGSLIYLVKGF